MSVDIKFVTFNIGQGWGDYTSMLKNNEQELKKINVKLNEEIELINKEKGLDAHTGSSEILAQAEEKLIARIEIAVAERLAGQADVIALQEVADLKRPLIKKLEELGFEIHTYKGTIPRFSTAIAIRKEQFEENSENRSIVSQSDKNDRSIYGQEITAIVAKVKNSAIRIAFSSLHSWGFQLYGPHQKRDYQKRDIEQIKAGIRYSEEAFDNLKDKVFTVIAGDMNNNPQNQPVQFQHIEKRGFEILEPNEDTNINGYDPEYKDRKIDFIFIPKKTVMQCLNAKVQKFFVGQTILTATPAKVLEGFDFTVEGNCSDHKPVRTTLNVTHQASVISQLYQKALKLLRIK